MVATLLSPLQEDKKARVIKQPPILEHQDDALFIGGSPSKQSKAQSIAECTEQIGAELADDITKAVMQAVLDAGDRIHEMELDEAVGSWWAHLQTSAHRQW
jgi:hypothetical protein